MKAESKTLLWVIVTFFMAATASGVIGGIIFALYGINTIVGAVFFNNLILFFLYYEVMMIKNSLE